LPAGKESLLLKKVLTAFSYHSFLNQPAAVRKRVVDIYEKIIIANRRIACAKHYETNQINSVEDSLLAVLWFANLFIGLDFGFRLQVRNKIRNLQVFDKLN